jgi:hypothetical protein
VTRDMTYNERTEYKDKMRTRERGVSDIVDTVQNITRKD